MNVCARTTWYSITIFGMHPHTYRSPFLQRTVCIMSCRQNGIWISAHWKLILHRQRCYVCKRGFSRFHILSNTTHDNKHRATSIDSTSWEARVLCVIKSNQRNFIVIQNTESFSFPTFFFSLFTLHTPSSSAASELSSLNHWLERWGRGRLCGRRGRFSCKKWRKYKKSSWGIVSGLWGMRWTIKHSTWQMRAAWLIPISLCVMFIEKFMIRILPTPCWLLVETERQTKIYVWHSDSIRILQLWIGNETLRLSLCRSGSERPSSGWCTSHFI